MRLDKHTIRAGAAKIGGGSTFTTRERLEMSRAIITAALSAQPVQGEAEPVAKALEWHDESNQDGGYIRAFVGFGGLDYTLMDFADGSWAWYTSFRTELGHSGQQGKGLTLEGAKAAAQADFDQRVQSCLAAPQPKQPAPAQDDEQPAAWISAANFRHHHDSGNEQTTAVLHRHKGTLYGEADVPIFLRSKQAPTVAVPDEGLRRLLDVESDFSARLVQAVGPRKPDQDVFARIAELRARAEQRETPSAVVGEGWKKAQGSRPNGLDANQLLEIWRQGKPLGFYLPSDFNWDLWCDYRIAAAPTSDGR